MKIKKRNKRNKKRSMQKKPIQIGQKIPIQKKPIQIQIGQEKNTYNGDSEIYIQTYDQLENLDKEYSFIGRNFYNNIMNNLSYDFDNIFDVSDIESLGLLLHDLTYIENRDYGNIFSSTNKINAKKLSEGPNYEIWYKDNNNNIVHSFSKTISKLICCVGDLSEDKKTKYLMLNVPIMEDDKIVIKERKFYIKQDICNNINGENYNDDNKTDTGAKSSCLDFMVKYCLFLKKLNPNDTKRLSKFCPCILNDPIIHKKDSFSISATLEKASTKNVRCVVSECESNINAYKPKGMRSSKSDSCPDIVDCSVEVDNVNVNDINDSNVDVIIDQKCGFDEDIKKTNLLEDDKEKVKEEGIKEIEKETQEKKESKETQKTQEKQQENPQSFFTLIINFFNKIFGLNKENFSNSYIPYDIIDIFYILFSFFIIYIFIIKNNKIYLFN